MHSSTTNPDDHLIFQPATAGSGFSPLSPDAIDLKKHPNYAKVPWLYTSIYPGDCVYIPASKHCFLSQLKAC